MSTEERVRAALEERRAVVNEAIRDQLPVKRPERLYEASRYLLDAGGKRLRPTLLLLVAEALTDTHPRDESYRSFPDLGEEPVDVMSAAVSIEVIQSFTLIHDDIMDDDDLRRGVPAVHREYDVETAILAGDTLYSKAFECMLATDAPPEREVRALEELATTCTEICEGQAFDVDFERRRDVTTDEYLEMVELKTAVLYAAAAAIPAILLGADEATVDALHGYGIDIGRAFQIQDDVLDLTTPSETLGKQRGSDLIEGKQTVVTLHARDHGVDVDGLVATDDPGAVTEATIEDAVAKLEAAGSIDYARDLADELVASGKARLERLPDNEARALLCDIADYLVEREY
ncbi:geranylfarnesyl diphosphate synthase [Halosegnis sp.]|uniref:geranylfarnesyl diphosphate synthase n=1 Tax=Halosegnis sp. TaxID=2864959 RepID=UPI0035D44F9D